MRLSLYYPVKPLVINQHFGENIPCVKDFGLPTQVVVNGADNKTCPVGYEKLYAKFGMAGHNGLDLRAGEQEVRAACAGTVVEIQSVPARGLGVGVITDEKVDVDGYGNFYVKLRYWHLKTIFVQAGQHVEEGQLLGISDTTGYSSGNHLHFEGQAMQKDEGGHPFVLFVPGNIAGAINIEPHFNGRYAEDVAKTLTWARAVILAAQKAIAWYIANHPSA